MEAELSTRLLSSLENMGFPLDSARAAVNRVKANHKANTASFDEALDSALQSLIDYEPTDSAQTTSDQGGSENGYGSGRIGSLDGSFQQTSADSLPEVIPSSRMRSLLSDLKGRMDHSIKAFASVPSTTSATPSKNLSPPISDSIERVIADTFVVGSLPSTPLLGTPRIKPSHTPILKHSNKSPFYPSSTPQKSLSPSNTIKRVRFELSKPSTSKSLPTTLEQSSSSSQSEQPQQVPPTPVESPPIQAEPRQKYPSAAIRQLPLTSHSSRRNAH
ncbi:hypothetical protein BCR33DRAFT_378064 [Rhizoclosmatium globosum]|uniref:Uncharacterized protein n=1 Tax=Rhizoclosmatium globosum TaxID=329046 RepID=A0A1Y2BYU8_9FUNG|nr:hypothetical protein BCR33DRAFT_378064 [Rhizoclosmatium globosum]|eukprot:ORY39906.1 hypothetical protein BCR33DRAFT_378064 [Rhizoclosmatium globosum]